ncbi:D-ribitol-5-phosphate cytidylyltransferase isoform X2 [Hemiscyllium ocellatum]|uniref:D-ribitol-5-phosphate cytidylyltransferase isoform X2 n=1 Tax=Hemiscyllium ocellatum TaxID=170820 RepID=UPI002965ECE9|nr:D-ribitol-5-phosphate cytidylyltransferase isoform X2 [Hemiscyllium ocellatum]
MYVGVCLDGISCKSLTCACLSNIARYPAAESIFKEAPKLCFFEDRLQNLFRVLVPEPVFYIFFVCMWTCFILMAEAASDSEPNRPLICNHCQQMEQAIANRRLDFSVAAVLPAGGSGERMGTATPKQFCQVLQRPLISITLETFERVHWINDIVVVVSKQNFELMNLIIKRYGHSRTTVVEGALTRHQSIFNGLKAFVENQPCRAWLQKPEVVIIHDAAAGAIRPLVSTVVATNPESYLDHSLERAKYRASEMPQAFTFDVIYRAYQQCTDYDFEYGTECLHLALKYCGISARLIDGPPDLWKVTYKRDLYAAESIIKESLSKRVCIFTGIQEEPVQLSHLLQEALQKLMEVDVLNWSENKESRCIQTISSGQYYNFVCINVNNFELSQEIVKLLELIENRKLSALYPVVLTVVHPNNLETSSPCVQMEDFISIKEQAKDANRKNILIFRLLLNYTQELDKVEESVKEAASIIDSLIKQRSPALIGQILVV